MKVKIIAMHRNDNLMTHIHRVMVQIRIWEIKTYEIIIWSVYLRVFHEISFFISRLMVPVIVL